MHRARAFFYVCAGVFLLALSYHLGARSAGAQAPGNLVVTAAGSLVLTANGDVYLPTNFADVNYEHWTRMGNVFSGGPVPVQRESFGALKSRYRGERGAAQPAPQDR